MRRLAWLNPHWTLFLDPRAKGNCTTCSNSQCSPAQYRTGTCGGTTNGFTCNAQPVCKANQFLKGSSSTTKGACATCKNIKCGADQYRSGTCSGTTDGFACNDQASCGAGQYLKAASELGLGVCTRCPKFTWMDETEHRHPQCKPQALCFAGHYLPTSSALEEGLVFGICLPCEADSDPKLPTVPRYQEKTSHREASCKPQEGCGSGHYLSGTSETKGVCQPCPAGQWMPFRPNMTACSSAGEGMVAMCKAARSGTSTSGSPSAGSDTTCVDSDASCPLLGPSFCTNHLLPEMQALCPKTCNACSELATTTENTTTAPGSTITTATTAAGITAGTGPNPTTTGWDIGCEAFAKGFTASNLSCHMCGAPERHHGSCDLGECRSLCVELHDGTSPDAVGRNRSSDLAACMGGCATMNKMLGMPGVHHQPSCRPHQGCAPDEYETAPATSTSDRVCQTLSACGAGERVVVPPTNTTDLLCGPCPLKTYQNGDMHREAACKDTSPCGLGEFMNATHAAADSVCMACPPGAYVDVAPHHLEGCKPHTACGKGEQLLAATAAAAGVCAPCGHGMFQDMVNHSQGICKSHATCGAGHFHSGASATSGGTCEPCPAGTYQPATNHTEGACIDQTHCAADEMYVLPLAAGEPFARDERARCEPCPVGQVQVQAKHRLEACQFPLAGPATRAVVILVLPCVEVSQLSAEAIKPILVRHSNGTLGPEDIDAILFTGATKGRDGSCLKPATATIQLSLDESVPTVTAAVANINSAISGGNVSIPVDVGGENVMVVLTGGASVNYAAPGPSSLFPASAQNNETAAGSNSSSSSSSSNSSSSGGGGSSAAVPDDDGFDPTPVVVVFVLVCLCAGVAAAIRHHNTHKGGTDLATGVAFVNPGYAAESDYAPVQDGDLYKDMPAVIDLCADDGGRDATLENATYVQGENPAPSLPQPNHTARQAHTNSTYLTVRGASLRRGDGATTDPSHMGVLAGAGARDAATDVANVVDQSLCPPAGMNADLAMERATSDGEDALHDGAPDAGARANPPGIGAAEDQNTAPTEGSYDHDFPGAGKDAAGSDDNYDVVFMDGAAENQNAVPTEGSYDHDFPGAGKGAASSEGNYDMSFSDSDDNELEI